MNTDQCHLFIKVVELGSFSAASREEYVTPQSVAQQIGRLEHEVGVKLLTRGARGVVPTAAGEAFYDGCVNMERDLASLVAHCRELDKPQRGLIGLGTSENYSLNLFARFVPEFLREHPGIDIEYVNVGQNPIADLRAGVYDVVEGTRLDAVDDVSFCSLVHLQRCCVLSTRNPLSRKSQIEPADLTTQRVYVFSLAWAHDLQNYLDTCDCGVKLLEMPSRDVRMVVRIAEASDVVYLFPTTVAAHYAPLISIPFKTEVSTEYGLLYLGRQEQRLSVFLTSAREAFA